VGERPRRARNGHLHFAATLDKAAELAVRLVAQPPSAAPAPPQLPFAPGQRYVRGLYSGGTLAYEAQMILLDYVPELYANAPVAGVKPLARATASQGHTIVDLGADEFTVGRLHPMLDHTLRIRRLAQEAADAETAVILLDVVLGDGAHPDPAGELAPAIEQAHAVAAAAGRTLVVCVVVVGTEDDPQHLDQQIERLAAAGAMVTTRHVEAVQRAGEVARALETTDAPSSLPLTSIPLEVLERPVHAINVGLASFADSLVAQGAAVMPVEWRPPAGGDERLMGILARMKQRKQP
jgi:FdrA protein